LDESSVSKLNGAVVTFSGVYKLSDDPLLPIGLF